MASELKPYLSAFIKWTKQHRAHWNLSPVYINGQFSKFMDADTDTAWMGFEAAWNTRSAPAATDTGLVTVAWEDEYGELTYRKPSPRADALVYSSQAEELLAAKEAERAEQWRLRHEMEADRDTQKALSASLKADNAAKDALIVHLRAASASDFDAMLALNSRIDDLLAKLAEVERD